MSLYRGSSQSVDPGLKQLASHGTCQKCKYHAPPQVCRIRNSGGGAQPAVMRAVIWEPLALDRAGLFNLASEPSGSLKIWCLCLSSENMIYLVLRDWDSKSLANLSKVTYLVGKNLCLGQAAIKVHIYPFWCLFTPVKLCDSRGWTACLVGTWAHYKRPHCSLFFSVPSKERVLKQ